MEPLPADSSDAPPLDLRHYLRVLWRRRWMVVATTVVLVAGALFLSLSSDDRYRASGELLITAAAPTETGGESLSGNAERAVGNEVGIIGSGAVQDEVEKLLGSVPSVSASVKGETDIILIRSENTDPRAAADAVNAYATAYETVRTARQVGALGRDLAATTQRRDEAEQNLTELLVPIQLLDARIAAATGDELAALVAERTNLNMSIESSRNELFLDITELNNEIIGIEDSIADPVGGVEVLNTANVPSEPFAPQPRRDALVAGALGLIIGLGVAFAWESLGDRINDRRSLKRVVDPVPVLGDIPLVAEWRKRGANSVSVAHDPNSAPAEAYRSLVTSIEFLRSEPHPVIHFTSAMPGEGKTTTVANVAAAFAEAGRRTVVIDGDMRRPRLHEFFGIEARPGLSTVLSGQDDAISSIVTTGVPNVDVLPAGPTPPNPSELLHGSGMADVVAKLREQYDIVLVDAPPVNPVTDTLLIGEHATGTVVVASAGTTRQRHLTRALEALDQAQTNVIGVIFNAIPRSEAEYQYDYSRGSGSKRRSRGRRWRRKDTVLVSDSPED